MRIRKLSILLLISIIFTTFSCSDKITEPADLLSFQEMVFVWGGRFSPDGGIYNVILSSFYISRFEVTQSQYLAVMGGIHNPNWTIEEGLGDNYPAYGISWYNAIEYCNRLSLMEGLIPAYSYSSYGTNPNKWPSDWNTGNTNVLYVSCNWSANGYRLPTEMEWEFAARGGIPAQKLGTFNDRWAGTNVEYELANYAWYINNSGSSTHPVGIKLPNELGLYDMSGNVWNWVWDRRGSYPSGSYTNPIGSDYGLNIIRGGACFSFYSACLVTARVSSWPTTYYNFNGFRVSRNYP